MKIGVFGGTFDPVHLGHMALANAALSELDLDKLIVMPTHVSPFKQGNRITGDFDRYMMLKEAFHDWERVEVSSFEIEASDVSYTYETLCELKKLYPGDELIFIMGTDSMFTLCNWYKGEEMLRAYSFAVSVRPGYREAELERTIENYKAEYDATIYKLTSEMPYLSSTQIRELAKLDESLSELVCPEVEEYIKKNGLFRD